MLFIATCIGPGAPESPTPYFPFIPSLLESQPAPGAWVVLPLPTDELTQALDSPMAWPVFSCHLCLTLQFVICVKTVSYYGSYCHCLQLSSRPSCLGLRDSPS